MTYRVLAARKVREQLEGAPSAASVAFVLLGGSEYKTIVFGAGQGFLDYQVFEEQRVVVLVDLVWL